MERARFAEALTRFTEALALEPADAALWSDVQFCRARLGDNAGSLEAADEMVRLRPDWSRGHYSRAFTLGRLYRYDEAAAAARDAVRLEPDYADNWRCLAQHLRLAGQPQEAQAAAERACELAPTEILAWIELGRQAREASDFATADRAQRRALELDPLNMEAHVEVVYCLTAQRRYQEAAAHARMALSLDWTHWPSALPNLVRELAISLAEEDEVDEACELLRTAIAAQPANADLRIWFVDIQLDAGRKAAATATAREAVAALPDDAAAWSCLARVLIRVRGTAAPEALASARRATELAPMSSWAWYLYGQCLRGNGHIEEAIAALHRCARAAPGLEQEQSRVSVHLRELGDPAGALAYAEHGVALSPFAARPHRRRAVALLALGQMVDALEATHTATELAPDDPVNWALRAEVGFHVGAADDARIAAEGAAKAAVARADRQARHHAVEARGFAAWADGDLTAAHAAFTEASDLHDACCCSRLSAALTKQPRPSAAELAQLIGPLTDEDDRLCCDTTCRLRAQVLGQGPA
jgi:tetratricopeptide (TPR) repeat protein